ncbi:Aminopeptidase N [uncultured Gammaproteobacteria bacterium]
MDPTAPKAILLKDYTPPTHLIDTVELRFDLREDGATVYSRLVVRANPAVGGGRLPLVLHGQRLTLVSVALDQRRLIPSEYALTSEVLVLRNLPAAFTLDIVTEIKPQDNYALEGLYKSSGNFCTQCEAEGFRKITYFLDRPDVMVRYTTTIEADKARYPVLLSNGNPVASGDASNGRHWVRWHDPFPKPCYLFALVAGNLVLIEDVFVTKSGRSVALRLYVESGNQDKTGHALIALKKAMAWDEHVFGLEYDLDIYQIVAVSDFNMGAMENKGLNIFNTKFVLAKPETATDVDFQSIESVIAHEYFHNWTGNRVTCRDWFQLSLKEGLTVFRDQEFSADTNSRPVKRIMDVQRLRGAQFSEDSGALAHPVRPESYIEINNFYTPTVYEKGAEVVRMIHTLLGPAGFRKGMDLYFERHDGQAVTCDDFVAAMADANGIDFSQFTLWYRQAGTPELDVTGTYEAVGKTYTLNIRQSCLPTPGQPIKPPLHIPLAVGLLGPDGKDLPLRLAGEPTSATAPTRVLHLRELEQRFVFEDIPSPPVPSLPRGFSAPVKTRTSLSDVELAFLMAHDSDAFNRWEAGQTLASRLLLALTADRATGRELVVSEMLPERVVEAVARVLDDAADDPAFAAQALLLPTEAYIAQQMPVIDVDGVHEVRHTVRRELGRRLRERWLAAYHAFADHGPFVVDAVAIGRRSIRNLCLGYLMMVEDDETIGLCLRHLDNAITMTDAIGALTPLVNSNAPQRLVALEQFYQKWRDDALVVNKWLTLQAFSSRSDTLSRVVELLEHPGFEMLNPNKVFALIGAFGANQVRFHGADGAGYVFMADQVLKLDLMNSQIAARMAGPFARWRRFDSQRQKLMRAQLVRLAETQGISPDVYEIVSKSLAE